MGCIYSNFNGECSMWDPEIDSSDLGVDPDDTEHGYCIVEEDPNPEDSCSSYEPVEQEDEDEPEWCE